VITWARAGDWALEGVSIGLVVAGAVGFASFAGRRAIVGELAEDLLSRRGVEASVEVLDVDSRGFIGRVRLGPAADPDFTAERVEVLLASPPPPEGPYALRPRAILVRAPRVKARWTGERLSFGALDPLVREFLSRPPDPSRPSPRVTIDDGAVRLATPWGLVQAGGDAVVEDSRLRRLDLALRPASLAGEGFAAELRGGTAAVRVRGEAADLRVNLAVAELQSGAAGLQDAVLRLDGRAPYPDTTARRLEGPVRLTAALAAGSARGGASMARRLEANLAVGGTVAGPFAALSYRGGADAFMRADALRAGKAEARSARMAVRFTELAVTRASDGLDVRTAVRASLSSDQAAAGAVFLASPEATLDSRGLSLRARNEGLTAAGPLGFRLTADRAVSGEVAGRAVRLSASSGAAVVRSGAGRLTALGPLTADLRAAAVQAPGAGELTGVRAELATRMRLLTGGSAPVSGRATAERIVTASAPATVSDAALRFNGQAGGGGFRLNAALEGRGALPAGAARRIAEGLPVLGDEPAYAAAIARGLARFRLEAPGLQLSSGRAGPRLRVTAPIRVRGDGGALAELTPAPGGFSPLGGEAGGFRVALDGGGLPRISAAVSRYRYGSEGFEADLRVRAALDAAIARGAVIEAAGRARSRDGALSFAAADCVRLAAARIELGENDVENLVTRLCPAEEGALIRTAAAGFRVRGRFEDASADAPFLQARITGGRGVLDASGGATGLTAVVARIAGAEAADTAPERRFHPVALAGTAALGAGRWTADLDILDAPGGTEFARAALSHEVASGRGGVAITADDLRFSPDGLQPHDLSPVTVGLLSAVEGAVDFQGALDWTEAGATSRGVLSTEGLDFDSPAGRVIGLKREITLSSLAPLAAPPGQTVTAERIEAFSPLTEVEAVFGMTADAVQIQAVTAAFSGGRLRLEPLVVPLAEDRTLDGAVRLDDVDLGALIEETGFADRVALQAVVDGRIPFQTGPNGLRFAGGELRSVRPGRLSISRAALDQVSGSGPEAPAAEGEVAPASTGGADAPAAPPNAFQDFAYQALENLAYDELSVAVDSRPEGRLGMVFTVNGRHDPPNPEQARVGLFDLLRGRAFQRRIPLPDEAPVNLTLDASINFDELLGTYLELQQARNLERSGPVQADRPTPAPD